MNESVKLPDVKGIAKRLEAQGAVVQASGVLRQIEWILFMNTWAALRGMLLYYTSEKNVFQLNLDKRWAEESTPDNLKGYLELLDERIHYINQESRSDRVLVYLQLDLEPTI